MPMYLFFFKFQFRFIIQRLACFQLSTVEPVKPVVSGWVSWIVIGFVNNFYVMSANFISRRLEKRENAVKKREKNAKTT